MALAFETTYGTPPVGGFLRLPFASTSLGAEQPLLNSELLGYGRDPLAPVKDAVTADGDVVVPLDAEALGFWLKAAFGAPTTTGTGPWTHEFQSGALTLPSMSIETGMPEVPRYAMYSGCVLDQLTWQMQRSGLLTATRFPKDLPPQARYGLHPRRLENVTSAPTTVANRRLLAKGRRPTH
jgi:hypothetical protein